MFESSASVRLVGGGRAIINFGSITYPEQTFVRLGEKMVAGIACEPRPAIYIWEENNGAYHCLGEINFQKLEDGLIVTTQYDKLKTS